MEIPLITLLHRYYRKLRRTDSILSSSYSYISTAFFSSWSSPDTCKPFSWKNSLLKQPATGWLRCMFFHSGYPSCPALDAALKKWSFWVLSSFEPENELNLCNQTIRAGTVMVASHLASSALNCMFLWWFWLSQMHLWDLTGQSLYHSLNFPCRKCWGVSKSSKRKVVMSLFTVL